MDSSCSTGSGSGSGSGGFWTTLAAAAAVSIKRSARRPRRRRYVYGQVLGQVLPELGDRAQTAAHARYVRVHVRTCSYIVFVLCTNLALNNELRMRLFPASLIGIADLRCCIK